MYSGATGSNDFSEAIKQYRADAHRHMEDTKVLAISHRKSRLQGAPTRFLLSLIGPD
jgi:hypothetical protein